MNLLATSVWPAKYFHEMIDKAAENDMDAMQRGIRDGMDFALVRKAWVIAILDSCILAGRA